MQAGITMKGTWVHAAEVFCWVTCVLKRYLHHKKEAALQAVSNSLEQGALRAKSHCWILGPFSKRDMDRCKRLVKGIVNKG